MLDHNTRTVIGDDMYHLYEFEPSDDIKDYPGAILYVGSTYRLDPITNAYWLPLGINK